MTKIAFALASAATLALMGGAAYAQGSAQAERGADLTRAEAEQRSAEAFARMDANDDGVLDAADREARKAARGERRAERQDARFERLDVDSDGAISRAEFHAAHDRAGNWARERFAERREGGERFGQRGRGKHRAGFGAGRFDGNGDRTITQAEFTAATLERFERADANRDGTVTAAERRNAMKAFREQRRAARTADQS